MNKSPLHLYEIASTKWNNIVRWVEYGEKPTKYFFNMEKKIIIKELYRNSKGRMGELLSMNTI